MKWAWFILRPFALTVIVYFLLQAMPGDFLLEASSFDETINAKLIEHHQLNSPWYLQISTLIQNLLALDFGPSTIYYPSTAQSVFVAPLTLTVTLASLAFILAIVLSLGFTLIANFTSRTLQKGSVHYFYIAGSSIPLLFLGPLLIWFFSIYTGWLPAGPIQSWQSYILPVLLLAWRPFFLLSRLHSRELAQVQKEYFIIVARAKGLSELRLLFTHQLKTSAAKVLGALHSISLSLFGGSLLIESLFGLSGLGQLFMSAILERDISVIIMTSFCSTLAFSVFEIVFSLSATLLDPRRREKVGTV
jgi:oligopeptide transport system permease protein